MASPPTKSTRNGTRAATSGRSGDGKREAPASDEDIRLGLGRRIREVRKRRGLSVRAVAEGVGVTGSMVRQIESGTVMPSVATLVKLAAVLGTQVGTLFDQGEASGHMVRRVDRPAFDYPDKKLRDEMISSDRTRRLEVLMTVLQPGGGTGQELFTHGAEVELCLALKGNVELMLGEETLQLAAGDAATFSGDIPHGLRNPTKRVAEVLWVVTPATY